MKVAPYVHRGIFPQGPLSNESWTDTLGRTLPALQRDAGWVPMLISSARFLHRRATEVGVPFAWQRSMRPAGRIDRDAATTAPNDPMMRPDGQRRGCGSILRVVDEPRTGLADRRSVAYAQIIEEQVRERSGLGISRNAAGHVPARNIRTTKAMRASGVNATWPDDLSGEWDQRRVVRPTPVARRWNVGLPFAHALGTPSSTHLAGIAHSTGSADF